ncbi:MAG: hypothetical protein WCH00_01205 [Candidatus Saccharibacteria bacterium]
MPSVVATFTIKPERPSAVFDLMSLLSKLVEADQNIESVEITGDIMVSRNRVSSDRPRRTIRVGSGRVSNPVMIADVLPRKIAIALKRHFDIEEVRELLAFNEKDLACVANIGPKSIRLIIEARDNWWNPAA